MVERRDKLLELARNRASILHVSSAWGACDDGMLIDSLVREIEMLYGVLGYD